MIKHKRHQRILSLLRREGSVDIDAITRLMPEVSRVTLRRDIAELADAGALKRTHGGAVLPDADLVSSSGITQLVTTGLSANLSADLEQVDAFILPPISGRGGDALRRHIIRRNLPFLAESAPQAGGAYLGPDNVAAGKGVGRQAGEAMKGSVATVLLVGQPDLSNTRQRSEGFERGFRETYSGEINTITVNGQGNYRTALRVVLDALRSNADIDVAFAVNDHSAQAVMETAKREQRAVAVYAAGGENPEFVGALANGGPLKAVAAFFPEAVGICAIDRVVEGLLAPDADLKEVPTPHAIITPNTLTDYYEGGKGNWMVRSDRLDGYGGQPIKTEGKLQGRRIVFMPHYPAHDWYRTMINAMRDRSAKYGIELKIIPPHHGIAAEVTRIREEIAQVAARRVVGGQTIIVGHGETSLLLAVELRRAAFENASRLDGLTVITNALDVLTQLSDVPGIKTILTSGQLQAEDRCLVGPSLGALFERMRADTAFLSVNGVTPDFGLSSADERLALAGSRFAQAARHVVALADHVAVGADSTHRIIRPDEYHELITDEGTPPVERQRFRNSGVEVIVANDSEDLSPEEESANWHSTINR
ncbi:MAG: substrate-binding domain-containing protein [Stappiaceae bacterium]